MNYKKNKNWNMLFEDGKLFILKGADEIYLLDEADGELYDAYKQEDFNNIDEEIIKKFRACRCYL